MEKKVVLYNSIYGNENTSNWMIKSLVPLNNSQGLRTLVHFKPPWKGYVILCCGLKATSRD